MSGFVKTGRVLTTAKEILKPTTGIPTLDDLIETKPETITVFYEDENSFIHNNILQIIFSQSYNDSPQKTFAFSLEDKHFSKYKLKETEENEESENSKMLIAWRYKKLSTLKTEFKFNLMIKENIPKENTISDLESFLNILKDTKENTIVAYSLFSPLFALNSPSEMLKILFDIRKYTKINKHRLFLSFPSFFFETNFSQFFDNLIQIESTLCVPGEPSYYTAIIELKKIASIGCLRVNSLVSYKYGLKLKSKNCVIEKIDIPPEETTSSSGCGTNF